MKMRRSLVLNQMSRIPVRPSTAKRSTRSPTSISVHRGSNASKSPFPSNGFGNYGNNGLSADLVPEGPEDSLAEEDLTSDTEDDQAQSLSDISMLATLDLATAAEGTLRDDLGSVPRGPGGQFGRGGQYVDYFGETTAGNLNLGASTVERISTEGAARVLGLEHASDLLAMNYESLRGYTHRMLQEMGVSIQYPGNSPHRGVFCSRTLNFRSLKAIGFDMDYTVINYDVAAWEGKAYEVGLEYLRAQGIPVEGLRFNPELVIRGLIIDREKGNLVKADRFGYVKRAMHGTRMLSVAEIRAAYGRQLIDLKDEHRWVFLNTLFSVSEAVMFAQLVDRMDNGALPPDPSHQGYQGLYRLVSRALFRAHVEGKVKEEIIKNPERFVELDPELPRTLLDLRESGKQLLLITNSDYNYTQKMMSFAFDRYLPEGMTWRDLFDVTIVFARKPEFFSQDNTLYEVVTADGLMRPIHTAKKGGLYCGGSARQIETALGVSGDDILYVGDHIYTDNALAKLKMRWRTCLILRELEQEIDALAMGRSHRRAVKELINKKEVIGDVFNQLRLWRQRRDRGVTSLAPKSLPGLEDESRYAETMAQLLMLMDQLDASIGPGIERDGYHFSERWGYLSRAGLNDKSQLLSQIEKYADLYTSRVSNFLRYTPFAYYRSPSQLLAHDRHITDFIRRFSPSMDPSTMGQTSGSGNTRPRSPHTQLSGLSLSSPVPPERTQQGPPSTAGSAAPQNGAGAARDAAGPTSTSGAAGSPASSGPVAATAAAAADGKVAAPKERKGSVLRARDRGSSKATSVAEEGSGSAGGGEGSSGPVSETLKGRDTSPAYEA